MDINVDVGISGYFIPEKSLKVNCHKYGKKEKAVVYSYKKYHIAVNKEQT